MDDLTVAPCKLDAARYAVEHWHYSGKLPAGKLVRFGVWEGKRFTGVVMFSRGASAHAITRWGVSQTEACELTRVALRDHAAPVSQIVAQALRQLRETNPGLRLVVSYADPEEGHHGGIYQAGNWIYGGRGPRTPWFIVNGERMHSRSVHTRGWRQTEAWLREHVDPEARSIKCEGKHRYLMPLDRATRRRIERHRKPYPAAEASEVTRRATSAEGQVRSLPAA